MSRSKPFFLAVFCSALATLAIANAAVTIPVSAVANKAKIADRFGKLPLSFIENRGQVDAQVDFTVQSPAYSAYFTQSGHRLRFSKGQGDAAQAHVVKVELIGADAEHVEGADPAPGIVSYFRGPKAQWKTAIPTFGAIRYPEAWPGIDIAYLGAGGQLESVYTVAPHADPGLIRLRYSGQSALRIDAGGNLVYSTSVGEVKESAPLLYQERAGKRVKIDGRFRLIDADTVGFAVATYDRAQPLVIDPTLIYSGYIGGAGTELALDVAVDGAGNAYVAGYTNSPPTSFPVVVGPELTTDGSNDAFVVKLNPTGTVLLYAGYIGGSGNPNVGTGDGAAGIAVDGAGNAYVAGFTDSLEASFPVTVGPDLTYNGGFNDAFVAKINPTGNALIYCGYIGGSGADDAGGIAVDIGGNAYVVGGTNSTQATFPEVVGPDLTYNLGAGDVFVAKINPSGAIVYAGYIGGSGNDFARRGIAVDGAGNAYVTGVTNSTAASFPVAIGPDLTANGDSDGFIAKVNVAGTALTYAGFIGGSASDEGVGIAVDGTGNAYVTGKTASTQASFPVLVGPDLTYNLGGGDGFVVKVNPSGSAFVYAGYIGGNDIDSGNAVAVDRSGNAYVGGTTRSSEATFPVSGGPDLTQAGGFGDGFVAQVNSSGSALIFATFVGGTGSDEVYGVAVDSPGNAYVVGATGSTQTSFTTVVGPDSTFNGGTFDAFVLKLRANVIFASGFE